MTTERTEYTTNKIRTFQALPVGWHYSEGVPVNERAAELALSLLEEVNARGFCRTNAFAGIEGDVTLTVYEGAHYYEFLVTPDGKVEFVHEVAEEEVEHAEGLSPQEALAKLNAAGGGR